MADEVKQAEEMDLDELSKAIDAASKTSEGQPAAPPEPEEISYALSTGQVYKGKTEKEVIEQLIKAQEHATIAIRDREAQLKAERAQKAFAQGEIDQSKGFEQDKFLELLAKDAREAERYKMKFMPEMQYAYQTIDRVNRMIEVNNFLNLAKDYPNTDENAQILESRLQALGRPPTAENMFIAYHMLRNEGVIKPAPAEQETYTPPKPPPVLGGAGASSTPDAFAQIDTMTDAQLEEFLKKKGLLR